MFKVREDYIISFYEVSDDVRVSLTKGNVNFFLIAASIPLCSTGNNDV
jgi:hypothetical protein